MTKTFRLESLKAAIDVATTLTKSWFRGHSRAVGSLVPRLFRPEYRDPLLSVFRPDLEMSTIEAFKRHAFIVSDVRLPPDDDRLGWLCVMQHYRTPTRLLDWTENALVALYFAVSAHGSEDGEVWAMLPWALNRQGGAGWGIPMSSEDFARRTDAIAAAEHLRLVAEGRAGAERKDALRPDQPTISFFHDSRESSYQVWVFVSAEAFQTLGQDLIGRVFVALSEALRPSLARSFNELGHGIIEEPELSGSLEFIDWFQYLSSTLVSRWGLEVLRQGPFATVDVLPSGACCLWLQGSPIEVLVGRRAAAEALGITLRPLMGRNPRTGEPIVIPWN